MAYIGNQPALQYITFAKQTFTANGSTVAFTLDNSVANENELEVFVNNVRQEPGSGKAYTASGTTLTMTEAPNTGDVFYCIYQGRATQTVAAPASTITGIIPNARFPNGTIIQVVTSVASDQSVGGFSTTNSTPQATGHSVTITPQYSNSDILIQLHTVGGQQTVGRSYKLHMYKSVGGATATLATAFNLGDDSDGTFMSQIGQIFLDDTVGNTSARVYSMRCGTDGSGTSVYNYQNGQTGDSHSVLTAMEIKR